MKGDYSERLVFIILFLCFGSNGFTQFNSEKNSFLLSETQKSKLVLPVGNLGGIKKLGGSPNEKLLLTEDLNSDIVIIDSDKLIELQRHNFGSYKITSSTFLNDSSIISICNDTCVSVWNFYSDKVDLYPISIVLTSLYAEKHGLYCLDKKGFVYKIEFSQKKIKLEKFITQRAKEIYFRSEKEIFLVNGKKLLFIDLHLRKQFKRKFDNQITALSSNSIENVLLGFDNGEILECNSYLKNVHIFKSMSDKISAINYVSDSLIISGSNDFSVVIQNKKEILNAILFDDWIVGMVMKKKGIIICTWNGMINSINENLVVKNNFEIGLKKATFFCQRENNLFISYNDGGVSHFDINTNQLINSHYLSSTPILGIDANHSSSELIIWNSNGVSVFDLFEKKIKSDFKRSNIVSAKFIPKTSQYIFCSDEYLYYFTLNGTFDSIPLFDSWSLEETKDNSIIASGLNRIIEVSDSGVIVKDLPNVGLIWTSHKINNNYLLGTSEGNLYYTDYDGKIKNKVELPKGLDDIEMINSKKVLLNCENGQLFEVNLQSKKTKIIADTKQEYGSWDFKVNNSSGKIIYPNSKTWNYKMDVDILDLDGKLLKKLENVGEVICISQSNRSLEFNQLDSNQVIFIVSDGTVKLWDINSDGKGPITQLGFDYYTLLKNELGDFTINGVFLKSGLLKLPIPGVDTLTFMNLKNGDWLVHDSKYRFDGTPGAIEKLYFTCGLEIVDLSQIKDSLYVPNLIRRYLNGETLQHIPQIQHLQICGYAPLIETIDSLNYKIVPRNGGVGEVTVFIDGIQRITYDIGNLQLENGIYRLNIGEREINAFRQMGKSMQIKVVAKTADNSVSSRGVINEIVDSKTQTYSKPCIHAVMIGVDKYQGESLKLKYAAKDANDLHVALQLAAKNYFNIDDTNRVFFYNLTINSDGKSGTNNIRGITPDRGNIIKTLGEIKKMSRPEDIILLFFAGHSEIVENGQLLLLTTESTRDNFQGIKINELLSLMNEIPAGKRILILDACHSGAAINNLDMAYYSGKRDVKEAEIESQRLKELDKLANKSGFAIITASSSDQKALELPQYEHGLLTYALLNSLKNKKDILDNANNLVLEKWFMAAEEEIKSLKKNQSAEKMVAVSYNLGLVNEDVKESINLKISPLLSLAEVINESQVLKDEYPWDNYQIRDKIKAYFLALDEPIYLLEQINDGSETKLVIKYKEDEDGIKLKFSLVRDKTIFFQLDKITEIQNLDKTLQDAVWELYKEIN